MIHVYSTRDMETIMPMFSRVKPEYTFEYDSFLGTLVIRNESTGKTLLGTPRGRCGWQYSFTGRVDCESINPNRVLFIRNNIIEVLRRDAAAKEKKYNWVSADTVSQETTKQHRPYRIGYMSEFNGIFFDEEYTNSEAMKQIESYVKNNPTGTYFLLKVEGTAQYKQVPSVVWDIATN